MNCNTTHYRANSSSVPGDPTITDTGDSLKHVALNRLDRRTQRWTEAARAYRFTRFYNALPESASTLPPLVLLAAQGERVASVVSPIESKEPLLRVMRSDQRGWEEIPWDPNLAADKERLWVSFLLLDRDAAWLGTLTGLLRYDLGAKKWDRYLPGTYLHAAARTRDGLWIAGYRNEEAPAQFGQWFSTHLSPSGERKKELPLPIAGSRASQDRPRDGMPAGLSVIDRDLWITLETPDYGPNKQKFLRYDNARQMWETLSPTSERDMDRLPEAVLFHPTLRRDTVVAHYAPHRVPAWHCPESRLPPAVEPFFAVPRPPKSVDQPGADASWSLANRRVLVRKSAPTGKEETFPLTGVAVPQTPPLYSLAASGNWLFVRTSRGISARDQRTGEWREANLSDSGAPSNFNHRRLLAAGGVGWSEASSAVAGFNPQTGTTRKLSLGPVSHELLEATATHLWLKSGRRLIKLDLSTEQQTPFEMPALPAGVTATTNSPLDAVAVTDLVVWYVGSIKPPDGAIEIGILGYDTKAAAWLPMLPVRTEKYLVAPQLRNGTWFVCAGESIGAVWRLDPGAQRWGVAAVPAPRRVRGANGVWRNLMLTSVEEKAIWCFEPDASVLWEYDREDGSWSDHPCPAPVFPGKIEGLSLRQLDRTRVATQQGLWAFRDKEGDWQREPVALLPDLSFEDLGLDREAVWLLGRTAGRGQGSALVARFDLHTKAWRLFGEGEGLPAGAELEDLYVNSAGIWAVGRESAYLLPNGGARWLALTELLNLGAHSKLRVEGLGAEGDVAWLAADAWRDGGDGGFAHLPLGPLVRLDVRTRQSRSFDPLKGGPTNIGTLLLEPAFIWLAVSDGVYRFDRKRETFEKVPLPAIYPANHRWFPERIVRVGKELWFTTSTWALRWKSPN